MSAAAAKTPAPTSDTGRTETPDSALLTCEHDRAEAARIGKPIGLVFEAIEQAEG